MERAVAAASDVRHPAPVGELVAATRGNEDVAGVRAVECGPHACKRVRVRRAGHAAVAQLEAEHVHVAVDAPAPAASVLVLAAGGEPELAACCADHALVAVAMHHRVDTFDAAKVTRDPRSLVGSPLLVEHVDL